MDNSTKQQIVDQLIKEITKTSLNKVAARIGVSSASLSNMRAGKWNKMSDELFRTVQNQLNVPADDDRGHADTRTYTACVKVFDNAKDYANVVAAVAKAGSGKTYSLDRYKSKNSEVFTVKCMRSTTERDFLADLGRSLGITRGYRVPDLMREVTIALKKCASPLIIIDEIEKTKGHDIFMLFIDLYNQLTHIAGIVLLGTPNLKKRIEHFNQAGRMGYDEVYSRIGGNVIELPSANVNDAKAICKVNHIIDVELVNGIANESLTDQGNNDLRRVDRKIHAIKLKEAA